MAEGDCATELQSWKEWSELRKSGKVTDEYWLERPFMKESDSMICTHKTTEEKSNIRRIAKTEIEDWETLIEHLNKWKQI